MKECNAGDLQDAFLALVPKLHAGHILISISVGKTEIKNGIRSMTCGEDAVRVMDETETALLRLGDSQ